MHRHLLGTEVNTAAPLSNGNRAADSYVSEAKFDTNMVIILAALLCALICALGLNSFVRCALRCSHRFALETPEQAAAQLAATGLKKRHLRQIPIAVYGSGVNIPATECPICLAEFEDGEKVRVLPKCHHGFHVRCIDTWLLSHSSCPNCRHSLLSTSSAAPAAAAVAAADSTQEANAAAEGSSAAATNESSQQGGRVVVVVEQGT
ncbi:hypothetical protein ACFX13_033822 [Malus domestica]|uniref:RING-type E3 ubiquitin transferase n=1 Tax=Malus domestica TaxID=3750 RepID=A0A498K078_MALDO|nr:RING-H2 finger protein ATL74-like [Malus domestica]RXI01569.1 hypothetical protein DVH24_014918 [Malus domestica]